MVTWDFFLFISSQQLYIFITLIKLSVAPPTSHMVWKIDFYQTYFISAVANVDYEYWFYQLMTSSLNASQCLAPLHNRLVWRSIFSFIKETKYPSHLRISQILPQKPYNPALEPWESQSIQNIRYGSHNLFHHCGILISKSFCLHACVLHIQTMVTQILVQNSIILKTWKNY